MHDSSYAKMHAFVSEYLSGHDDDDLDILDFGSQEIDSQLGSSYRSLFTSPKWRYRGLDMELGTNVDILITDPFSWDDVEDDSVDVVVSGQTLEHVDFFWISVFEIGRILRPGGLAAVIAPSAGPEHRYPLDCWRYYADGFASLARYIGFDVLDVYTDWDRPPWSESMLVMHKPIWDAEKRHDFKLKHRHQKAVLSPDDFADPVFDESVPLPSVLEGSQGDRLGPILDAFREVDGLEPRIPLTTPTLRWRLKYALVIILGPRIMDRYRSLRGREAASS